MRGINVSSMIFLLIVIWNIVAFSFSCYSKRKSDKPRRSGIGVLGTLIINVVLIIILYYFSTNIGVTHYSVELERLPIEFEGYKILQISDFHTGSFKGGGEKLLQKVMKEKPDIIVITGDLIDETAVNLRSADKLVSQLVLVAPVYFVSGNHDIWYHDFNRFQERLKSKGVVILDNKIKLLQRGNSCINLFGIDDPDTWNDTSAEHYLNKKLSELQQDSGYNILLFHRANMFDTIKTKGYQLVLSGHMHGGQVQIPFVGGLISPQQDRKLFPKYTDGKWKAAGTTLIVSRGLGNIVPIPRILNPPEVVVVTLKHK